MNIGMNNYRWWVWRNEIPKMFKWILIEFSSKFRISIGSLYSQRFTNLQKSNKLSTDGSPIEIFASVSVISFGTVTIRVLLYFLIQVQSQEPTQSNEIFLHSKLTEREKNFIRFKFHSQLININTLQFTNIFKYICTWPCDLIY